MINSEIKIVRATQSDADLLVDLATQTFVQSHASSAPKKDIDAYVSEKYNLPVFENELENENYVYHLLYYKGKAVGFSKIILNESHSNIKLKDVTKLERLYILDKYHDLKLGKLLFDFNVKLSKDSGQKGMWLFVWVDNTRAFNFYTKCGFNIIGKHDFRISDTHSNPNYQMMLRYHIN